MITRSLIEKARLHIRRYFSKHIPGAMQFHDLEHTLTVSRTAKEIGRASGLDEQELLLVELAALFHDTGYAVIHKGHEEESAKLATVWMRAHDTDVREIKTVSALIMATRSGHTPRGLSQRVLRDADSAKAGQADFLEKGERLRAEIMASSGAKITAAAWGLENLSYLEKHRFATPYARQRFGKQKEINLALLRRSIAEKPKHLNGATAPEPFMDRDLSWLAFNARVLQEAQDPEVPLLERLKFVAIHSSNLDEFYRVRVAQLRGLRKLGKWNRSALGVPPGKHIELINQVALKQQDALGKVYRGALLPALRAHGIRFRNEGQLSIVQRSFVLDHFKTHVAPLLRAVTILGTKPPFIEDRRLYLVLSLSHKGRKKKRLTLVNVPSDELGRFITLPSQKGGTDLMYLDDAIRLAAPIHFKGWTVEACHAIKLSRDAELYLEEEFTEDVADKVRRSLRKRSTGVPARFLYDRAMPKGLLEQVRRLLEVKKSNMLEGGRYHNLSDLMALPIIGHPELREKPLLPISHSGISGKDRFRDIRSGDVLLHFPYHSFKPVISLLTQAARDPKVERIAITLYRVASKSLVCEALAEAARSGKQVDVVMEVQARFDEGNNLFWASVLSDAGARISYGVPGFKVHCKLLLIQRREVKGPKHYAYLGTGNFNEQTARIYSDMALLTSRKVMTDDVREVFNKLLSGETPGPSKVISTSPDHLRDFLERAIDREIEQAFLGKPASILLKLNSLEDKPLIRKLYDADRVGVKVRLIVRGICCLVPGVPQHSATIEVISIVDRFLEHARAYVFHNLGKPTVHLASADWMERNMDRRVETAFPILDEKLKAEVIQFLELEWKDNVKARIIDKTQTNPHRTRRKGARKIRSQVAWYECLKKAAAK